MWREDLKGNFALQVQIHSLQRFAAQMAEEGSAPVRTQLAMGRLLGRLDGGQAAERSRFTIFPTAPTSCG